MTSKKINAKISDPAGKAPYQSRKAIDPRATAAMDTEAHRELIWAMAGDNADYADVGPVAMETLR